MTKGKGEASHLRKGTFTGAAGARFRIKGIVSKYFSPKNGYCSKFSRYVYHDQPKNYFLLHIYQKISVKVLRIFLRRLLRRKTPLFPILSLGAKGTFCPRWPREAKGREGSRPRCPRGFEAPVLGYLKL